MSARGHGLLVEFAEPEALLEAVRRATGKGWTRFEAFSPFRVEGLEDYILPKPSPIPALMLGAAALGACGGFYLQVYAARDYPLDVGGRPLFSWPAFVPVTFELGVLTAVLVGIGAFLWRAGLPRYDHPVFGMRRFVRASSDRFFLWFPAENTTDVLREIPPLFASLKPRSIEEVPA